MRCSENWCTLKHCDALRGNNRWPMAKWCAWLKVSLLSCAANFGLHPKPSAIRVDALGLGFTCSAQRSLSSNQLGLTLLAPNGTLLTPVAPLRTSRRNRLQHVTQRTRLLWKVLPLRIIINQQAMATRSGGHSEARGQLFTLPPCQSRMANNARTTSI